MSTAHSSSRLRSALAGRLGPDRVERWFAETEFEIDAGGLEVRAPSAFVARWIETHFSAVLRSVAAEILAPAAPDGIPVHVRAPGPEASARRDPSAIRPGPAHERGGPGAAAEEPRDGRRRPEGLDRTFRSFRRLDDFVVGPSNALAYTAACRLIDSSQVGAPLSPLFIHGECGVGKTHLLQGICRGVFENGSRRVRYVPAEQFTNEFLAALRSGSLERFRTRHRQLEILAIDDVHFFSNKSRTQSEFLHTLDAIGMEGARVVLASDEHPQHISRFSAALVSRFLSGMVVKIDRPDLDTRRALVRRLAESRGLCLDEAACDSVAAACVGSVREIEGSLTKLAALQALGEGDRIGHDRSSSRPSYGAPAEGAGSNALLERVLSEQKRLPARPVRLPRLVEIVCLRLGVTRADVLASSRHPRIVLARGMIAWLARDLTTLSYPEIARGLGRRCHSTVHTAAQRLSERMRAGESCQGPDGRPVALSEFAAMLRDEIGRDASNEGRDLRITRDAARHEGPRGSIGASPLPEGRHARPAPGRA